MVHQKGTFFLVMLSFKLVLVQPKSYLRLFYLPFYSDVPEL